MTRRKADEPLAVRERMRKWRAEGHTPDVPKPRVNDIKKLDAWFAKEAHRWKPGSIVLVKTVVDSYAAFNPIKGMARRAYETHVGRHVGWEKIRLRIDGARVVYYMVPK